MSHLQLDRSHGVGLVNNRPRNLFVIDATMDYICTLHTVWEAIFRSNNRQKTKIWSVGARGSIGVLFANELVD